MNDWRDDPATERQKSFAAELGLSLPGQVSKGDASDLITRALEDRDSREVVRSTPHPRSTSPITLTALIFSCVAGGFLGLLGLVALLTGRWLLSLVLVAIGVTAVAATARWHLRRRSSRRGAIQNRATASFAPTQERVHARPNTFDITPFINPKTGRFQFPRYKPDPERLVRIKDDTDYSELWGDLDSSEREGYSIRDFENDLIDPEVDVDSIECLFYRRTVAHLGPLKSLKANWSLVEELIHASESDPFIFEARPDLGEQMLKNGWVSRKGLVSPVEKLDYYSSFTVSRLREVCDSVGLKAPSRKQEIVDAMIQSGLDFPLPPPVLKSGKFDEWFAGLVRIYVEDIRKGADRFHPLYIEPIWQAALDANDLDVVRNAIQHQLGSRYWIDRFAQ